jgi:peptidoglycan/LPS O-acetylase OafA/YrhL
MAQDRHSLAFRPDIEGLRGIAILLVVGYHSGLHAFPGGYVGVDVFFVLSGFLITGLLIKELESTGRVNLGEFYARRCRRLLPAVLLVVVTTLIAGRILYAPFEQRDVTRGAFATAIYASNVWFARRAVEYLATDVGAHPLLHTWSLAVEEQFYLVWPVLLSATLWLPRMRRPRFWSAVVLAVLGVVSLAICVWLTRAAQPWAFFSSPARAWEFAIGGLVSLLADRRVFRAPAVQALSWLGLLAIIGSALLFDRDTVFPGLAALLPVLGTAAILIRPSGHPTLLAGLLSMRPLRVVGLLSYSWYLWHWPVLRFGEVLTGPLTLTVRLTCVGLAFVLASVTFKLIENPVRRSRWLAQRPRVSLAFAGTSTAAAALLALTVQAAADRSATTPGQRAFTDARDDVPTIYRSGCHLAYGDTEAPDCSFGDLSSNQTIALFGDSHAAQWFTAVEKVARDRGWKLVALTKSSCPAASVQVLLPALNRKYVECDAWRESTISRLIALHPIAVIMASSSLYLAQGESAGQSVSPAEWMAGTRRTLSRLSGAGVSTVVLRDDPYPGFDVPTCLARAAWTPWLFHGGCGFTLALARDPAVFQSELEAGAALRGVTFVDLSESICATDGGHCEPVRDGVVKYRDSHHLTSRFSSTLAHLLEDRLSEIAGHDERRAPVALRNEGL